MAEKNSQQHVMLFIKLNIWSLVQRNHPSMESFGVNVQAGTVWKLNNHANMFPNEIERHIYYLVYL